MTDVSVLTPSYRYGRFIEDAILSVRGQDGISVEHVVQDGGSDDSTVDVLRRSGGVVWDSRRDAGQSDALNTALARATGAWIGWLNADEFYLPGALGALLRRAEATGADVVYGDCIFVDAEGKFERLLPQHRFSARVLREYGCYIPSNATLVRRSTLGDTPWDPTLKRIMDWDLYMKLLASGSRFAYVPYPIAAFRTHPERVTSKPAGDSSEEDEVASRYGLPSDVQVRWRSSRIGRWMHPAYKLVDGAYMRQRLAATLRGRDLRWFRDGGGFETWRELLRRSYARQANRP